MQTSLVKGANNDTRRDALRTLGGVSLGAAASLASIGKTRAPGRPSPGQLAAGCEALRKPTVPQWLLPPSSPGQLDAVGERGAGSRSPMYGFTKPLPHGWILPKFAYADVGHRQGAGV